MTDSGKNKRIGNGKGGVRMKYPVNRERLIRRFSDYVSYDSETYHEKALGERVVRDLKSLGLTIRTDGDDPAFLTAHPESHPNIYGFLPGNAEGDPVLLSAHLDTVSPGTGKRAVFHEDGTVTADGTTVLGADDVSGLTAILEALSVIREEQLTHPDIEVLITTAEEAFCEGSKAFDFGLIRSKKAYVLDLDGAVGTAAIAAPTILSFTATVKGKAAHAGFRPESGINALSIAATSLYRIPAGRADADSTVNFGTIHGGTARNIVPDLVTVTGEVRSLKPERAEELMQDIRTIFTQTAAEEGGSVSFTVTEHVHAYRVEEDSETVRHYQKAAEAAGLTGTKLRTTCGGSDANRLNANGIEAIVVACAMEDVHTTKEQTSVSELVRAAELATSILTTRS